MDVLVTGGTGVLGRLVVDRLLAAGAEPAGLVDELGDPRVYGMADVVRDHLAAVGQQRAVVGIRMPGQAAAAYRAGANLTLEHADGRRTWEQFVSDRAVSWRSGDGGAVAPSAGVSVPRPSPGDPRR